HSTCRHREVFDVASDAPLSALMGPVPIPYGSTHRAEMHQLRSARSCEKRAQRHAIDVDLDVGLDGGEPSCGLPYSESARSNDLNSPHAAWLSAIMSWSCSAAWTRRSAIGESRSDEVEAHRTAAPEWPSACVQSVRVTPPSGPTVEAPRTSSNDLRKNHLPQHRADDVEQCRSDLAPVPRQLRWAGSAIRQRV